MILAVSRRLSLSRPVDLEPDLAFLGEFRGIAEQVEEHLPDLGLVGAQGAKSFGAVNHEAIIVLRHQWLDGGDDLLDQSSDVERLDEEVHLARLDLREVDGKST